MLLHHKFYDFEFVINILSGFMDEDSEIFENDSLVRFVAAFDKNKKHNPMLEPTTVEVK